MLMMWWLLHRNPYHSRKYSPDLASCRVVWTWNEMFRLSRNLWRGSSQLAFSTLPVWTYPYLKHVVWPHYMRKPHKKVRKCYLDITEHLSRKMSLAWKSIFGLIFNILTLSITLEMFEHFSELFWTSFEGCNAKCPWNTINVNEWPYHTVFQTIWRPSTLKHFERSEMWLHSRVV